MAAGFYPVMDMEVLIMDERLKADLDAIFSELLEKQGYFIKRQLQAKKGEIFAAAEKILAPRYATFAKEV